MATEDGQKIAFVFPGQGSQAVGMGVALYDAFHEAKEVFDEVDDALNQSLFDIIRDGSQETLTLTENAQPALMAVSMAVVRVLEKQAGKSLAELGFCAAGHSLGEYSALCATRVISLKDAATLLKLRGQSMQRAVSGTDTAMAAIIGLDFEAVNRLVSEAAPESEKGEILAIANDNGGNQLVISGEKSAVERAMVSAKEAGAKRALPLAVSAPFHCPLMQPAAEAMQAALADTLFNQGIMPILPNVTAKAETDPQKMRNLLVDQICGRVRWRETVLEIVNMGGEQLVELGAGKVLSNLAKRIHPDLNGLSISDPQSLDDFLTQMS